MKKLFILLALPLALCLAACSDSDDNDEKGPTLTHEQAITILCSRKNWTIKKTDTDKIIYVFTKETLTEQEVGSSFVMTPYDFWGLICDKDNNYVKGKILRGKDLTNSILYRNLNDNGFQVSYDDGKTWLQALPGELIVPDDNEEETEVPEKYRLYCEIGNGVFLSSYNGAKIERTWNEGRAAGSYITSIRSFKQQKDGSFAAENSVVTLNMNKNGTLASATNVFTVSSNYKEIGTYNYQYDKKGRIVSADYTLKQGDKITITATCSWTWNNADLITSMTYTKNGTSTTQPFNYPTLSDNPDPSTDKYLQENKSRLFPQICSWEFDPFNAPGLTAALGLLGPGPAIIPYYGAYELSQRNPNLYCALKYDVNGLTLISEEFEEHKEWVPRTDQWGNIIQGEYVEDPTQHWKKTIAKWEYTVRLQ